MRTAFKEWAVIVDALGRGEQIVLFRKGGISEGPGGFRVANDQFLLLPTRFHQQRGAVVASAQVRYDNIAMEFPSEDKVRIQYAAEVAEWQKLDHEAQIKNLHGQHIWREDVLTQRFEWGKGEWIIAMALKVFELETATELPMRPEYGGCKSWVTLLEDISTANASPVLSDSDFGLKLAEFRNGIAAAHR